MFKIGEFSKLTQVSIRMLRYYDETGLLKPAETDPFTKYRLYSTEQIPVLNQIIFLRNLGFNVSEITLALSRWNDGFIAEQLEKKQQEIENAIRVEQAKLANIQLAKKDIELNRIKINYNVSLKSVPSYHVLSLRRIVPNYYAEGELWGELTAFAEQQGVPILNKPFTIYHDTDYRETDVDMEICAPVAQTGENIYGFVYRHTEPIPIMACTMVYGSFENIASAYVSFAKWLEEHHQYQMLGQSRQIVHRGPWNEEDPDKYLIEIQIPLGHR